MATKTNLLATINGFLTAIITQAKVRSSASTIVDEIYPKSVTDSQATETYTTKAGSDISYDITIIKSGNIAHIKGYIINETGIALSPQNIFSFKDNEFKTKAGVGRIYFKSINSDEVTFYLDNTGLNLASSMSFSVNDREFPFITYITQD